MRRLESSTRVVLVLGIGAILIIAGWAAWMEIRPIHPSAPSASLPVPYYPALDSTQAFNLSAAAVRNETGGPWILESVMGVVSTAPFFPIGAVSAQCQNYPGPALWDMGGALVSPVSLMGTGYLPFWTMIYLNLTGADLVARHPPTGREAALALAPLYLAFLAFATWQDKSDFPNPPCPSKSGTSSGGESPEGCSRDQELILCRSCGASGA